MKYTLEFKLECVEKYKKGIRIDLPPGVKHRATFPHYLMGWIKAYEDLGAEGLMHKSGNREWAPEERLPLVAKVLAGSSMREVARSGRIPYGTLHQWVRRHREMGHGRLAVQLPVREGVPIPRAGHVRDRHRRLGPLLIAQFRADDEDARRGVREEPEPGGPGLPRRPQGWQYQMRQYGERLREKGIAQSMSRKGNCIDNCIMESFFGTMKREMLCGHEGEFGTFERLKAAIAEHIDCYNNMRIKGKTKWMPPAKYREASMRALLYNPTNLSRKPGTYQYWDNNKWNEKLDLLSDETSLPRDRTNPKTYTIVFEEPVTRIQFYEKANKQYFNDNNRGRICIGNITFYTKEGNI